MSAAILLHKNWRTGLLHALGLAQSEAWRVIRLWLPLMLLPLLYFEVALLNQALYEGHYFDATVIGWEQFLFESMPSQTWAEVAPYLWLSELLHAASLPSYPIIVVPPLILFIHKRYKAMGQVVFIFMLVSLVHCLIFIFFPVQGPRYLFPAPTAGDIEEGWLYRLTHWILETGSSQGTAFPSAHVAVSFAQTAISFRVLPRWGWPLVGLSLLLAASTVYGGFHYLIDALAGATLGLLLAWLAIWLLPQLRSY